jgi:hypothetical protein
VKRAIAGDACTGITFCFPDDITMTADGVDTYHLVKAAGRYKYVTVLHVFIHMV